MNSSSIRKLWTGETGGARALRTPLIPLSWLYAVGVQMRNFGYSWRWLRARSLDRCVISIGNLTVGGTGKTPTCLWIAEELSKRGLKTIILSRGYKRNGKGVVVLHSQPKSPLPAALHEEIAAAGDEPVMMSRIFGHTVAVAKERYDSACQLLQEEQLDLFLLDDGFQHRQLKRDLDVLVLGPDAKGSLLPAGPFREPRSNLRRADIYVITGNPEEWRPLIPPGRSASVFCGSLEAKCLVSFEANEWQEYPLSLLGRRKIVIVAGIADPRSLYRMIYEWEGEIVDALEFPDHHAYSSLDWQRINRAARNADLIVTTEKDILKLLRFPFAKGRLLALRVVLTVENGEALIEKLCETVEKRRTRAVEGTQ